MNGCMGVYAKNASFRSRVRCSQGCAMNTLVWMMVAVTDIPNDVKVIVAGPCVIFRELESVRIGG